MIYLSFEESVSVLLADTKMIIVKSNDKRRHKKNFCVIYPLGNTPKNYCISYLERMGLVFDDGMLQKEQIIFLKKINKNIGKV